MSLCAHRFLEDTHDGSDGTGWYSATGFRSAKNFVSRAHQFAAVIHAKADSYTIGNRPDRIRMAIEYFETKRGSTALGQFVTKVLKERKGKASTLEQSVDELQSTITGATANA